MKKTCFLTLFLCFGLLCAHAETIILRTGARVHGTVVFQNEEVVILRNAEGARFQYPRTDVERIMSDEEAAAEGLQEEKKEDVKAEELKTPKKVSILLEIAGGAAYVPTVPIGGAYSVDLLVGSHHIKDRHLFLGGGVGIHGMYLPNPAATTAANMLTGYTFLPIQLAARIPFMEQKHTPVGGVALGYGIALSKDYIGGLYSSIDFGYRCQVNPKTAISIVAFTQLQQATMKVVETVEGVPYTNMVGRYVVSFGGKFALYF